MVVPTVPCSYVSCRVYIKQGSDRHETFPIRAKGRLWLKQPQLSGVKISFWDTDHLGTHRPLSVLAIYALSPYVPHRRFGIGVDFKRGVFRTCLQPRHFSVTSEYHSETRGVCCNLNAVAPHFIKTWVKRIGEPCSYSFLIRPPPFTVNPKLIGTRKPRGPLSVVVTVSVDRDFVRRCGYHAHTHAHLNVSRRTRSNSSPPHPEVHTKLAPFSELVG